MVDRSQQCKACEGVGMLADDEGWQYRCPVCDGDGTYSQSEANGSARVMSVDENNRLLD
jgi:DnaJ-class molecular chaperone